MNAVSLSFYVWVWLWAVLAITICGFFHIGAIAEMLSSVEGSVAWRSVRGDCCGWCVLTSLVEIRDRRTD